MTDPLASAVIIGVASMVGAIGGAYLLWLSTRRKVGLDDLQARYDQMQEDVTAERSARQSEVAAERTARMSEGNSFRSEITALRIEMVSLRAEVRVRDDYIGLLRRHIGDCLPPPPPPYPAALTGAGQPISGGNS